MKKIKIVLITIVLLSVVISIGIDFYFAYKKSKLFRKLNNPVLFKVQDLALDLIEKKGKINGLTGYGNKLTSESKLKLISKGEKCYLYKIKLKDIVSKKEYKKILKNNGGIYDNFYIKGHYNSREKCKKEDYEDCNIYLMEKGIKVYDDDYECYEKQNKKK